MEYKEYKLGEYNIKMLPQHPGSGTVNSHLDEFNRFNSIINEIKSETPIMIELGAFWSLWSIIFRKKYPKGKTIIVEGDLEKLNVGINNLSLNDINNVTYYHNTIYGEKSNTLFSEDIKDIKLSEIINSIISDKIDLIHMDIQGSEIYAIDDIINLILNNKLSYSIIATHSESIEYEITNKLKNHNIDYSIIKYEEGKHDGEIIIKSNNT